MENTQAKGLFITQALNSGVSTARANAGGQRVGFKEDIAKLFTFSNASNAGTLIIISN